MGEVHAELKLLCGGTKHLWTEQYSGKENVVSVVQLKIIFSNIHDFKLSVFQKKLLED